MRALPLPSILPALVLCFAGAGSGALAQERTPSPPGAEAYILSPKDGARVHDPFIVQFGLKGMGIAPAGVKFDNTGHFHLLIDGALPADLSLPLPASATSIHYGKGQIQSAPLSLAPGKHTLQVVLGDLNHIPHDPPVVSKKITVTVKR